MIRELRGTAGTSVVPEFAGIYSDLGAFLRWLIVEAAKGVKDGALFNISGYSRYCVTLGYPYLCSLCHLRYPVSVRSGAVVCTLATRAIGRR